MITSTNPTPDRPLADVVTDFLADLAQANRSAHTRRAYAADLAQFGRFCGEPLAAISPEVLRAFFSTLADYQPATRARKQAALASFCAWAFRHELIASNPMARVERVQPPEPRPRGLAREQIEAILAVIPVRCKRDRLLFRLIYELGLRVGEALGIYVGDLDLSLDDEHLRVLGKGGRWRTVLLDNAAVIRQVRAYLKQTGYRHGPLFRAAKNGREEVLRYQSIQERWAGYCSRAGVRCTLHQLRHSHATELVNDGVSLATIRKRLGHKSIQTTLRYAEQSDAAADAELRERQRRRSRAR